MSCTDAMIWIGQSYFRILCDSKKRCFIPFTKRKTHCYVHEAEWRGCCRKVPMLPKWLLPGKSRIFLAHRDTIKSPKRGKLFGYYVFARPEAITSESQEMVLPVQNVKEEKDGQKRTAECWDNSRIVTHRKVHGKWIATGQKCPPLPATRECEEGKELTRECWDGSKIVTHRCIDGKWVKTDEKCPDLPSAPKFEDGQVLTQLCWDGSVIITHICMDGEWVATNARCPNPVPPHNTMFETERSCSLRLKPGSIYLVDALTAEVTDNFALEMAKTGFVQKYLKARDSTERDKIIKNGRKMFVETVQKVNRRRKKKTAIASYLRKKAKLRGELVLFNNPPIFEKYPQVAFQGLVRIDGDDILQQIAQDVSKVTISYCDRSLASQLCDELGVNKALAERFLKKLSEIVAGELISEGSLRLASLCNFSVVRRNARRCRNPRTGEIVNVPAKNVVKCNLFKQLKDAASQCQCPKKISRTKAK
jgi:DNA-binding protein HU-beta